MLGIDIETVSEAWFNTREEGDLMSLKFTYMPLVIAGGDPSRIADRTRIVLHSDHSWNPSFSFSDSFIESLDNAS